MFGGFGLRCRTDACAARSPKVAYPSGFGKVLFNDAEEDAFLRCVFNIFDPGDFCRSEKAALSDVSESGEKLKMDCCMGADDGFFCEVELGLVPLTELAGEKENGWISGSASDGGEVEEEDVYESLALFWAEGGDAGKGTALASTRFGGDADTDADVMSKVGDTGESASIAEPMPARAAESIAVSTDC
jgi:hypothetical protein